ncbi:hypothetical protein XH96_08500 [Bradyrhizobium sp. CCBAU 51765]|uniref:Uncharacterized protein n=1 Tax=Bradyrhizobium arachidis TaxID=858423 RepID=A0AAE7NV08_9BRAD|nr:hypothetical protein [Bradyrhizobium sp. CCBAU 21360]QOZ07557.1 hypothetical protein XH96_08500 [Bradyrhizobium sp. CCBAU 51765]QOZ71841.1 hypothetical protein WN72_40295 [Bradyrhizobium arachidis]
MLVGLMRVSEHGPAAGCAARLAIVTSLEGQLGAFHSLTENLHTAMPSGEFLFRGRRARAERALI